MDEEINLHSTYDLSLSVSKRPVFLLSSASREFDQNDAYSLQLSFWTSIQVPALPSFDLFAWLDVSYHSKNIFGDIPISKPCPDSVDP